MPYCPRVPLIWVSVRGHVVLLSSSTQVPRLDLILSLNANSQVKGGNLQGVKVCPLPKDLLDLGVCESPCGVAVPIVHDLRHTLQTEQSAHLTQHSKFVPHCALRHLQCISHPQLRRPMTLSEVHHSNIARAYTDAGCTDFMCLDRMSACADMRTFSWPCFHIHRFVNDILYFLSCSSATSSAQATLRRREFPCSAALVPLPRFFSLDDVGPDRRSRACLREGDDHVADISVQLQTSQLIEALHTQCSLQPVHHLQHMSCEQACMHALAFPAAHASTNPSSFLRELRHSCMPEHL